MNKSNMIKTAAVLMMVTLALTLTTAASNWSQFQRMKLISDRSQTVRR